MRLRCIPKTPWAVLAALLLVAGCEGPDGASSSLACDDPPATDAEQALELHATAWNEADAHERRCRLERSLAADAWAVTADGVFEGQAEVAAHLDEHIARQLADGLVHHAAWPITIRHAEARSVWTIEGSDGAHFGHTEEWLEFDDDGRLWRIHRLEGSGETAPLGPALGAWQQAWNAHDSASRTDALGSAATEDVRFTDLVRDVEGREALAGEIARQQAAFDGRLELDDPIEVFATVDGQAFVARVRARMLTPEGGTVHIVDYVRFRDGRIERLSGFPSAAP